RTKVKGNTGAHGGGGGHAEDPRGVQRFSALVVQRRGENKSQSQYRSTRRRRRPRRESSRRAKIQRVSCTEARREQKSKSKPEGSEVAEDTEAEGSGVTAS